MTVKYGVNHSRMVALFILKRIVLGLSQVELIAGD
ncbi:hypothetical protein TcasGA2_TC030992 [Tribolium castaneum]|uniref:Uncharacterized protein n=1 Tax=Tribolium castaneum TaxID=7070 RepID=A0A139WMQ4_TRICA|nr:hypothetical protein TcasGA2_TC030992 [Tribolium castaneum]